jgi:mono/diheme cytochrome c family protein
VLADARKALRAWNLTPALQVGQEPAVGHDEDVVQRSKLPYSLGVMLPSPGVQSSVVRRVLAAMIVLACSGAVLAGAADPPKSPPGDPAAGKKIFQVKCVPCHKADGSGGIKLTGNPTPNFRDPKRMADPKYTDDYFRDCMTNGKVKSGMQPITKIGVDLKEVPNLIAYIRTFSQKK